MPDCSAGGASEMECRQIAELLGDYLDGSIPSQLRDLIDFHIDGCQPCVAFMNTYRGTIGATRTLPHIPVPPELKQRLLTVLRRSRDPR
ncbi:MAG: anti-sigma factor [Candidatus Rokuibacteriota bacterium]